VGEVREIDAEAVEAEGDAGAIPAEPVRNLPEPANGRALVPRGEVRTAALAAAGGLVAGMATVAVVRAARTSKSPARGRRKERERLASRSFQVDIHLLRG